MTSALPRSLIALAAGGTGGHMFPAEALARELVSRGHPVMVLTDRRGEIFADAAGGVEAHRIRSSTLKPGLVGKLRTAVDLVAGYFQSARLFKARRPAAVVGFGGYPSAPPVAAAGRQGIPVMLHEQNAILGRANRLLARWASHLATGIPLVGDVPAHLSSRTTVTGNPVRTAIADLADRGYAAPMANGPIHLLVLGGSQGARVFSSVIPDALTRLAEPLRRRLQVSQQCRPEDMDAARAAYAGSEIDVELSTFFTDVPDRLARAHLVVCRSGASTVAEITAAGRPAILVPYPHAMDDHQTANATALDRQGAGWMMPQPTFTADALAIRIDALISDGDDLTRAATAARGLGRRDAAARLADLVETLTQETAVLGREASA
ncbi:undecaprenyldiphospho-muramoylpentapeptide beta-N-acetylglucosaminyltransferase [Fodinicurvata sp. EGI_FJ10296]|uniref:undecaprenyldiphospho-muramoylpentapeptide beta-N-acetylglucosaminyltransferase n=1 Tax=Fodinicurvata sp. EGI_FJ10296 TaxID=3231908 RepID=UPI00345336F0